MKTEIIIPIFGALLSICWLFFDIYIHNKIGISPLLGNRSKVMPTSDRIKIFSIGMAIYTIVFSSLLLLFAHFNHFINTHFPNMHFIISLSITFTIVYIISFYGIAFYFKKKDGLKEDGLKEVIIMSIFLGVLFVLGITGCILIFGH